MLALIMAGGSGTRFWPKSRLRHPKQLLQIFGEGTMIQQTVRRLDPILPKEKIFIVSTQAQQESLAKQLPEIPLKNFITEPYGKNTAPCIGLSALYMRRFDPDAAMVVLPADHLILDEDIFCSQLQTAEKIAKKTQAIVTIGVRPTFPATGYGYIQYVAGEVYSDELPACRVKTFAEKPNYDTACRFLESGDFLWNSGIYVWTIPTIMGEIEEHLPDVADSLVEIDSAIGTPAESETIERVYRQIKNISIDYGVMENARNVMVLPSDFRWNDLGSWDEVHKISPKDENDNVLKDDYVLIDTKGCYIDVEGKMLAAIGLRDLIVVDTPDALLICHRNRAQEIKEVVETLRRKKLTPLL